MRYRIEIQSLSLTGADSYAGKAKRKTSYRVDADTEQAARQMAVIAFGQDFPFDSHGGIEIVSVQQVGQRYL